MMSRHVTITTGARVHFGPLSYRPANGRHFGGVGLMVDSPGVRLTLSANDTVQVTGDPEGSRRVKQFVSRIRESQLPLDDMGCRIHVERVVPSHAGFGSGTQLGLAVARGLAELAGETDVPVATLARRVGRGLRSAVGLYGFEFGGLIVDAGQREIDDIGALACRLAVPDEWRVLLITPPVSPDGLSGAEEEQAFAQLGSMPLSLTNELSRLVLTELLPAVTARDFDGFSQAVFEYGSRVGEFFSRIQGGTFGSPETDRLVDDIRQMGVIGVGQTSWGPTVFVFAENEGQANSLASHIRTVKTDATEGLSVEVVAPRNQGVTVEVSGSH